MRFGFAVLAYVVVQAFAAGSGIAVETFTVTVPDQAWTMEFEAPPLMNYLGQSQGDAFNFRAVSQDGFNLSIFVEKPKQPTLTHEACYEFYWPLAKRNPQIDQDSVKMTKAANFVKVSYQMDMGNKTKGPHVNYYFAFQGRWIDVHVSRFPPGDDDDRLLAAFEKSLTYQVAKKRANP